MKTADHWAAPLILARYQRGAAGPDAFDCWGLVRWVFQHRHGVQMPALPIGEAEADALPGLLQAARASGFAPVAGPLQQDDVLLMRNAEGGRHIGVLIKHRGLLKILHACSGHGVRVQPLDDLRFEGFGRFEPWRRA